MSSKSVDNFKIKMMTALQQYILAVALTLFLVSGMLACDSGDTPFLDDRANILTDSEKQAIISYNEVLLSELDIHFKLIILRSAAEDINEMAVALFDDLGAETSGAKGLLYLVDPKGEQVRIEVGYDLEHIFTDGFVGYIEEKQMVPFFEIGSVGTGVTAGTELFVSRVMRAGVGDSLDLKVEHAEQKHYSGGGGAKTDVVIGIKDGPDKTEYAVPFDAQFSPEQALEVYKVVLRTHQKDPHLGLFTPETREFFEKWVVTDAQQDNELRALERFSPEKITISGDRAVIRFSVRDRTQAPYFLQRGSKGWMLDFWTMTNVIRMNHKNMWFFKRKDHPYMFGFSDWQFDKNGFGIISE